MIIYGITVSAQYVVDKLNSSRKKKHRIIKKERSELFH